MTREIIGIVISIMALGSGLLMVLRPERFRDAQVIWWHSNRGVWPFRILGLGLILLAILGATRMLNL